MDLFKDIHEVFYLVKQLALVGVLISTTELIYNWKDFSDGKMFSWKVISSRPQLLNNSLLYRLTEPLMRFPNFIFVLGLRLIIIITLLFMPLNSIAEAICLALIIATSFIVNYRSPYGQDGSDQMSTILFVVLFLHSVDKQNMIVAQIGIWFICLQTLLSYCTAGIAKSLGPKWTSNPVAVFQIFNTATYGSKFVAGILKDKKNTTALLTWSTVFIEITFPLCILLGLPITLLYLAWGAVFHLANAVIMGLNAFFWAFIAAYPAVIFCAIQLQSLIY